MPVFKIPRQTDLALVRAAASIRDDLKVLGISLQIQLLTFEAGGTQVDLPDHEPEKAPALEFILSEGSEIVPWLHLKINNQIVLQLRRHLNLITDEVTVAQDQSGINQIPADRRPKVIPRLIASARKHFRAADSEASFSGGSDSEWNRYRDSQQVILNSLEQTQRTIVESFTRKSLELETTAQTRLDERQSKLEERYNALEKELSAQYQLKNDALVAREAAIDAREKNFNTKEARYVARSQQQNQIDQIKSWLEGWSLTEGTRSKRHVVAAAYCVGAFVTGILAVWFSYQSMEILRVSEADLSKIAWWQWALLSLKSLLPLAAFITFVIYFIRWSSEWARQHADEEFRNRTRVLDIGRSAWLLEAVRDAQDNQKELPGELLKELTRNLFAYAPFADTSDLHPQAITDLIMQGLSSLRVKTPDGTEVAATRRRKGLIGG
jgi:hypothetical protein